MLALNDNHARHIVSTLKFVDRLLEEGGHIIACGGVQSTFPRYVFDAPPEQCKVLADSLCVLRQGLLEGLESLGLSGGGAEISALRALQVQLISAAIALEELTGPSLKGYGELSPGAGQALEEVVLRLRARLRSVIAFLDEARGGHRQAT